MSFWSIAQKTNGHYKELKLDKFSCQALNTYNNIYNIIYKQFERQERFNMCALKLTAKFFRIVTLWLKTTSGHL